MIEPLLPSKPAPIPRCRDKATAQESADSKRTGKVLVMIAIMLVPLFGFAAFAVDGTYLMEVKKEAENSAEAAALAGALGLIHDDRVIVPPDATTAISQARDYAQAYAGKNRVGEVATPQVDRNDANALGGEIVIGRIQNWSYADMPLDPATKQPPWNFENPLKYNAVRVFVKRTAERNGQVGLFFANIFGIQSSPVEAVATAITEFGVVVGFNPTADQGTKLLPFAVCVLEWDEKIYGIDHNPTDDVPPQLGPDEYAFQGQDANGTPTVGPGTDGLRELLMYPQNQGGGGDGDDIFEACTAPTDSEGGVQPGNFGTVDIGHDGNSTADLIRQILYGISEADLAYHDGGTDLLLSEENPDFDLNGDTGISAGIRNALESIVGQCRVMLLYSWVDGNGNTAQYTIVRYQPVRIMEVKLTGNPKYIRVQPAACIDPTAIIDPDAEGNNIVFHPPRLIE